MSEHRRVTLLIAQSKKQWAQQKKKLGQNPSSQSFNQLNHGSDKWNGEKKRNVKKEKLENEKTSKILKTLEV